MIKNGDNVILKFNPDGEICRQRCKAYIYESMENALMYKLPNETLVEYAPVKRGRWIPFATYDAFKCSECNRVEFNREPYCHCGAKMEC